MKLIEDRYYFKCNSTEENLSMTYETKNNPCHVKLKKGRIFHGEFDISKNIRNINVKFTHDPQGVTLTGALIFDLISTKGSTINYVGGGGRFWK